MCGMFFVKCQLEVPKKCWRSEWTVIRPQIGMYALLENQKENHLAEQPKTLFPPKNRSRHRAAHNLLPMSAGVQLQGVLLLKSDSCCVPVAVSLDTLTCLDCFIYCHH